MALIYRIDCRETGLTYVGQTVLPLDDRWRAHVDYAKWVIRYRPEKDTYFARAIRKYGVEAFVPSVIEETDEELLDEREIHWIAELGTFGNGYNSTKGGGGRRGMTLTEETCEKIRQKALGRKHTDEIKKKIAAKKRGVKQSEEVIAKRVAGYKASGYKHSEETKAKMHDSNVGQKRSDEARAKMSAAKKGKPLSDEHKAKLRAASIGQQHSEEAREKISAATSKRIGQFDENCNLINEYPSAKIAAISTGCSNSYLLSRVGTGKLCKGFLWKYLE